MDSPDSYGRHRPRRLSLALASSMAIASLSLVQASFALPPPEDTPEEILRTEIILEARSPVDGEPLTASEYVELQEELAESEYPLTLNGEIPSLILQLQIRKVLNILSPVQIL